MPNYDHKHFSTARNQLYHISVHLHDIARTKMPKHPTPEAEHLISVLCNIAEQACEAWMAGEIMAVSVDRYASIPLPGFEAYDAELKDPMRRSGVSSKQLGDEFE